MPHTTRNFVRAAHRRPVLGSSTAVAFALLLLGTATTVAAQPDETFEPGRESQRLCFVPGTLESELADPQQLATALFSVLSQALEGPTLETVALPGSAAVFATAEARQRQCDLLLRVDLSHHRGGGGFLKRTVGGALGSTLPFLPGDTGVAGTVLQMAASQQAVRTADLASGMRAKDQVELAYYLSLTEDASPVLAKEVRAKARNRGEDILTPLVEAAAREIATALTRVEDR